MKDARLEELTSGLMEQFRVVKGREGVMVDEIKIADSLSNMAGKVLKMYMVELAYRSVGEQMPNLIETIEPLKIEKTA